MSHGTKVRKMKSSKLNPSDVKWELLPFSFAWVPLFDSEPTHVRLTPHGMRIVLAYRIIAILRGEQ